jgi:hypothetical protein
MYTCYVVSEGDLWDLVLNSSQLSCVIHGHPSNMRLASMQRRHKQVLHGG